MVGRGEDTMVVGRSGGGGRLMGREGLCGGGGNRESVRVVEGVGGSVLVAVVGNKKESINDIYEMTLCLGILKSPEIRLGAALTATTAVKVEGGECEPGGLVNTIERAGAD
ncbi:hypothetical protein Droror1_Dr00000633 [Drosera rotundifolia]